MPGHSYHRSRTGGGMRLNDTGRLSAAAKAIKAKFMTTPEECIVCKPLEILDQWIERMCRHGHHLDDHTEFPACDNHAEGSLLIVLHDAAKLLNSATDGSPDHEFAGLILRDGRLLMPQEDRYVRIRAEPYGHQKLESGTWLIFTRQGLFAGRRLRRRRLVHSALAHMQVACRAVDKAQDALNKIGHADFPPFKVKDRSGDGMVMVTSKRFVAESGARKVKSYATQILECFEKGKEKEGGKDEDDERGSKVCRKTAVALREEALRGLTEWVVTEWGLNEDVAEIMSRWENKQVISDD